MLFIDPDDFVVENTLSPFLQKVYKEELEVLYMGFEEWGLDGEQSGKIDYKELNQKTLSGVEAYIATRNNGGVTSDRSVSILFNREFLLTNNLEYTKGIPFIEDGHFVGKVLSLAPRCGFCDNLFYIYEKRLDSSSTKNRRNDNNVIKGFLIAANDLKSFKNNYPFNKEQISLVNHLIAKFALTATMSAVSSRDINTIFLVKDKLKRIGLSRLEKSKMSWLKKYIFLYNFSYWAFVFYYIAESRAILLKELIKKSEKDHLVLIAILLHYLEFKIHLFIICYRFFYI